jgi:maltooligosyltrehalose synthase
MFNPISTYRIQFHKGFTFQNSREIIPYLYELGVKTLYASPIFEAVPGSNHGYDVVNPHRINPDIGTLAELEEISTELKQRNMYWLQGIVPNHMAFHPDNVWLMDVLEKGREPAYTRYFDIIWNVPELKERLMVPFLGTYLTEVIDKGQLKLSYNDNGFYLNYSGQRYPLNQTSVIRILKSGKTSPPAELQQLLTSAEKTGALSNANTLLNNSAVKSHIKNLVEILNKKPSLIREIADEQYYQLCFGKTVKNPSIIVVFYCKRINLP